MEKYNGQSNILRKSSFWSKNFFYCFFNYIIFKPNCMEYGPKKYDDPFDEESLLVVVLDPHIIKKIDPILGKFVLSI